MQMPDMCDSAGLRAETVFLKRGEWIKARAVWPFSHLLHPWPVLLKKKVYIWETIYSCVVSDMALKLVQLPWN